MYKVFSVFHHSLLSLMYYVYNMFVIMYVVIYILFEDAHVHFPKKQRVSTSSKTHGFKIILCYSPVTYYYILPGPHPSLGLSFFSPSHSLQCKLCSCQCLAPEMVIITETCPSWPYGSGGKRSEE